MIRILGFYNRVPTLSPEQFRAEWKHHGDMISNSPNVAKYIKSYVQHYLSVPNKTRGTTEKFFDCFSEACFESIEQFAAMRAEPEFAAISEHTVTFIDCATMKTMIDDTVTVI